MAEGAALNAPGAAFPLIDETDYYKQKVFYEQSAKNADDQFWGTMKWMTVPFLFGPGLRLYNSGINRIRFWRENRFANIGYIGQTRYVHQIERSIRINKNKLYLDFDRLGNPAVEIGQLKAARDSKWMAATSQHQRQLIDEAYSRIIIAFGRDAQTYAGMPQLQQAYARALFGDAGSVHQLEDIYAEYIRLTKGDLQ